MTERPAKSHALPNPFFYQDKTMSKQITESAEAGQTFFGTPSFIGTPTATVNGVSASLTPVTSGVVLTTPAAQNDAVVVTFTPAF